MTDLQYKAPVITLTPLNDAAKSLASEPIAVPRWDVRVEVNVDAGKARLTYRFEASDVDADRNLVTAMLGRRDIKTSIWELSSGVNKWRVTPTFINAEQIKTSWTSWRTIDFQIVLTKEENEQRWKDIDERLRQRRIDRGLGT